MSRIESTEAFTVGEKFAVRRCLAPTHEDGVELGMRSQFELGGQAEWFWGVPGIFHSLASPKTGQPVPAAPTSASGEAHSQSLGYWCALHYLLLYRLGWSIPQKGLMLWYDQGKPTDDATLALVSEVWDRDGFLDVYLAWLLRRQLRFLDGVSFGFAPEIEHPEPLSPHWQAWLRRAEADSKDSPAPHFSLAGGSDPLHLTGHSGEEGKGDPHSILSIVVDAKHRAVFTTNHMDAWYWDLRSKVAELPKGDRSWRIDVFVRPVGFLGNYRLSRSTSLLFAGRHRHHSLGN